MSKYKGESLFWGSVIFIIGVVILFDNLDWVHINVWAFIGKCWPLILVYIGLKNIILFLKKKK